ncbi:hypothetical protein [Faecalibacter bovis]|uniref:Uncharacterized protein n=1 Tax=Faecalibacter bovis TaxID=2898187 RepID=A0ABX7XFT7_9FLAO|nr:hypothetical protein [Faecalibacter bovis]QTV06740.1 hypothetical protein J9309_05345 [Faecalibacter bovis]
MINPEIKIQLISFFDSTKKLKENQIIRSSNFSGDIAEYLCQEIYGLTLCENQREIGYDAVKDGIKYQIKINNSSQKTNQGIGNPSEYNYLLLLITSESKLFNPKYDNYFITIYKIENKDLLIGDNIAKSYLFNLKPEYLITQDFQVLNIN